MVQPRLYPEATFLNGHLAADHTGEHVQHIAEIQRFPGAVVVQGGFRVGLEGKEPVSLEINPGVAVVV